MSIYPDLKASVLFLGYALMSWTNIPTWLIPFAASFVAYIAIFQGFLGTLITHDFKLDGSVGSQISWPLPVPGFSIFVIPWHFERGCEHFRIPCLVHVSWMFTILLCFVLYIRSYVKLPEDAFISVIFHRFHPINGFIISNN
jgi:hypothetical protein